VEVVSVPTATHQPATGHDTELVVLVVSGDDASAGVGLTVLTHETLDDEASAHGVTTTKETALSAIANSTRPR
jgi:hypothetical protein